MRYKALGNSVAIPCVDFVLLGIALVLTAVYGFLSIRFDDTSILDFIRYAAAFLIAKQQFYEWKM